MSRAFRPTDARALDDLHTFLARAARVEEGSVRLIAGSGVLAVYVAALYPVGLADETPTVLGLRTLALADAVTFDTVVPIRSLLPRIERARAESDAGSGVVALPMEVGSATWAGISPPRGGWHAIEPTGADRLEAIAQGGIREVAAAIPDGAGERIVRTVRSEVWGRPIAGAEHLPAGAAFAALALGFLGAGEVRAFESGPWTRLTTELGHVLVRRRAWTLSS